MGGIDMIERFFRRIFSYIKCFMINIKYGSKCKMKYTRKMATSVKILCEKNSKLDIDENFMARDRSVVTSCEGGSIKIGKKFFMNYNCMVTAMNSITIGDNVCFGPNVCIYDHDHNFDENGVKEGYKTGPVVIGNNVWIGAGAVVLRGTTIGDNCIIGAGCIVKGEIPNNSLVKQGRELVISKLEKR